MLFASCQINFTSVRECPRVSVQSAFQKSEFAKIVYVRQADRKSQLSPRTIFGQGQSVQDYYITLETQFLHFLQIFIWQTHRRICECKKSVSLEELFYEREVSDMAKNSKQTSKSVATKASKILKDGRYGKDSKSVAGSALAQTKPGKKK